MKKQSVSQSDQLILLSTYNHVQIARNQTYWKENVRATFKDQNVQLTIFQGTAIGNIDTLPFIRDNYERCSLDQ